MADILNIEDGVLEECTDKSAASVEIPAGVTKIGDSAFRDCTSLASVVIPASVTKIDRWAFSGCTSLASVVIPDSVTEIGERAFDGCNITELSHPCLTIKGGVAIKDGKVQYCASQAREIVIPTGVTEIGYEAFYDCTSLMSVTIPESVTEIGCGAFSGCAALASVVIPASVTEIGKYAFSGCKALKTVTLADNLAKVNADWFESLPEDCEIVCTEGSAAYKAVKRSSRLKAHVKALALETAKTEKIRQIQQVSAERILRSRFLQAQRRERSSSCRLRKTTLCSSWARTPQSGSRNSRR